MKKAGRNDPCPCGSGKKFKKCCESKLLRGRFAAAPIASESAPLLQRATGLSSLFQSSVLSGAPPLPARLPQQASLEENGSHLINS